MKVALCHKTTEMKDCKKYALSKTTLVLTLTPNLALTQLPLSNALLNVHKN